MDFYAFKTLKSAVYCLKRYPYKFLSHCLLYPGTFSCWTDKAWRGVTSKKKLNFVCRLVNCALDLRECELLSWSACCLIVVEWICWTVFSSRTLPPQFPNERPVVKVSPPLHHPWVNDQVRNNFKGAMYHKRSRVKKLQVWVLQFMSMSGT